MRISKILMLVAAVALIGTVATPAEASPIITCGYKTIAGEGVRLAEDLVCDGETGIILAGDKSFLDCAGHTISGMKAMAVEVYGNGTSVQNCIIKSEGGILVDGSREGAKDVVIASNEFMPGQLSLTVVSSPALLFYNNMLSMQSTKIDDLSHVTLDVEPRLGANIVGGTWLGGNHWYELTGTPNPKFDYAFFEEPYYEGKFRDSYPLVAQKCDPVAKLKVLIADVLSVNLQQGIENAFDSKLSNAMDAVDRYLDEGVPAAVNMLEAFINAVEAQRGSKLTDAQADSFEKQAQAIIDCLQSLAP